MNKLKIYVFGNIFIQEDRGALTMIPSLQKDFPQIQFITTDPNEDFPPDDEEDLIILDMVKGIKEICLIDFSDLKVTEKSPISPHDYDLLLHLLLLKKRGKINSIKIIGIPYRLYDKNNKKKAQEIIKNIIKVNILFNYSNN